MIDVKVMDTDAKSYLSRPLDNVLESQEKEKKYIQPCLAQQYSEKWHLQP